VDLPVSRALSHSLHARSSAAFPKAFRPFPHPHGAGSGTPGVLGNHTDYNQGLVMALAVDRYVFLAVSPRRDGRIELISSDSRKRKLSPRTTSNQIPPRPGRTTSKGSWPSCAGGTCISPDLMRRCMARFLWGGTGQFRRARSGHRVGRATDASLHLFPISHGLDVRRQEDGSLAPLLAAAKIEIAKVCQRAESQFVGVNCGLLDPLSSLSGRHFTR